MFNEKRIKQKTNNLDDSDLELFLDNNFKKSTNLNLNNNHDNIKLNNFQKNYRKRNRNYKEKQKHCSRNK